MKRLLFLLFFLPYVLNAQVPSFSQYQFTPLQLNPALTGSTDNARLIANTEYWTGGAYDIETKANYALSFEKPIFIKNEDRIGLGLGLMYKELGDYVFYESDYQAFFKAEELRINTYFSYSKKLFQTGKETHYLSVGTNVAFVHQKLSLDRIIFTGQLPSIAGISPKNQNYADVSIGLNWKTVSQNSNSYRFGFSLKHVNEIQLSYLDDLQFFIPMLANIYALLDLKLSENIRLLPRAKYTFQDFFSFNIGTNVQFLFGNAKNQSIEFGAAFEYDDSFFLGDRFSFNLAYKHPQISVNAGLLLFNHNNVISSTYNPSQIGVFQIGLQYHFNKKTKSN